MVVIAQKHVGYFGLRDNGQNMHTYSPPPIQNNLFPRSDSVPQAVNPLMTFSKNVDHLPPRLGCSCEQVYGGRCEYIPDFDPDLTNQGYPLSVCFRLCTQVVSVWFTWTPIFPAMCAASSGFACHVYDTFFQEKV